MASARRLSTTDKPDRTTLYTPHTPEWTPYRECGKLGEDQYGPQYHSYRSYHLVVQYSSITEQPSYTSFGLWLPNRSLRKLGED
ncbi:hypothetical protein GDO81_024417 [Engystomops pustulosus]|uniref:Uncharacterized protein n=1 Tax=Engystomops pustulosus TaxID=76066 RepID=A0AAV6ZH20_ENGPU|nr:hypothetical protein GDO81_024417 [Engystomops pustulosus]